MHFLPVEKWVVAGSGGWVLCVNPFSDHSTSRLINFMKTIFFAKFIKEIEYKNLRLIFPETKNNENA